MSRYFPLTRGYARFGLVFLFMDLVYVPRFRGITILIFLSYSQSYPNAFRVPYVAYSTDVCGS
jgi:hypothetical protein